MNLMTEMTLHTIRPQTRVLCLIGVALLVWSTIGRCEDVPKASQDVLGWGKTRWGMSADDLLALYPDQIKVIPSASGPGTVLEIHNYELYGEPFNVLFNWHSGRLSKVVVGLNSSSYLPHVAKLLLGSLTHKYGQPSSVTDERGPHPYFEAQWVFRTSIVTLYHAALPLTKGGFRSTIGVSYAPNRADKL